jgi:hypothetical protein
MTRWLAVLGALAVLASCGRGDGESTTTLPAPPPGGGGTGGLILSVEHPVPLRSGAVVGWRLTVRNEGPAVNLVFPSGQDGDVVLRQVDGEERYRWSADRAFTQIVREVRLGPGEARSFELAASPLSVPPGAYQLVASLSANPAPPQVQETVRVEP